MNALSKPYRLHTGDTIATISPCNGWAGDNEISWKYELGKKRLIELGLNVVPAPNSLKGSEYLSNNPKARAEDFMWAFQNTNVKAVITNIGGNDSLKIIPYINENCIANNHKIFIGYSDVMNLHILCYKCGLSTFYGDNLLNPIAEAQGWQAYSRKWFKKVLFNADIIGPIKPSTEWSFEDAEYTNPHYTRNYYPNAGYELIQGKGVVQGPLFGGHIGLMGLSGTKLELAGQDFEGKILFFEDIPEFYTTEYLMLFLNWLGQINALQKLKGIIFGKISTNMGFEEQKDHIINVVGEKYGLDDLPILYGLNFGHSSPMCVLPYGATAEINCNDATFSILESGVL